MKAIRTVLACLRRADKTFNLIQHGDHIIIGLSGGKDSVVLTYVLSLYKKFSHTNFTIQPVILDLGFPHFNPEPLRAFCASLGLSLIVSDNRSVYPILKKHQKEGKHLPCSICSRMKKAAINNVAHQLNYSKVAFAHHADDAIETLFMNEIYGAKVGTFAPKMHLDKSNIEFIRPLIFVREKDIKNLVKEENLPVLSTTCPADKMTTRQSVKNLLSQIYKEFPTAKENFLTMISNYEQEDLWGKHINFQIDQEGLNLHPVISASDAIEMMNIRREVFIKEQNISYEDEYIEQEETTSHYFLIYLLDKPIGIIRYRQTEIGFCLGRFAILKEYRHKGYGTASFSYLVNHLEGLYNPCTIYFHAQLYLKSFYENLGFTCEGEPFIEANIPHITMKKTC